MRPLKPQKSIEGINRAKMFIKRDLDLFIGYPGINGKWISHPEGKEASEVVITREHIHKAIFTINKLVRDFPKALPKIVGDVEKWSDRNKSLLELLKQSIHNETTLPESLAKINPSFGDFEKKLHNKIARDNKDIAAAGRAYFMLNRRKQAAKMFSIAINKCLSDKSREFCTHYSKLLNTH